MRRALPVVLGAAVIAGAAVTLYLRSAPAPPEPPAPAPPAPGTANIPRPVFEGDEYRLRSELVPIPRDGDPVAQTLTALLETAEDEPAGRSAIPKGTRLLGLDVKDGVATVNLSGAFARVNEKGDTGEALAQNSLRIALAQYPQVKSMRVLVEGKLFESAHAGEWDDIPVRMEDVGDLGTAR